MESAVQYTCVSTQPQPSWARKGEQWVYCYVRQEGCFHPVCLSVYLLVKEKSQLLNKFKWSLVVRMLNVELTLFCNPTFTYNWSLAHLVANVLCSFNKTYGNINSKWSCKIMCHCACLSFARFILVNNARLRYSLQYQQNVCPSLCVLWSPFGSKRRLKIPKDDLKSKMERIALQKNTLHVCFLCH